MGAYISQQLDQEMKSRCQRLTQDPVSGDALLAWMKMVGISREQVIRSMLVSSDLLVTIDERFDPKVFASDSGQQAAKGLDMLLGHPDFRDSIVTYLSKELRGNQKLWLQSFCAGLGVSAMCNLLVMSPPSSVMARLGGWPPLKEQVLPFVPAHLHEAITDEARRRRQLAKLYALTGWASCRDSAKSSELDKFMASDLGM